MIVKNNIILLLALIGFILTTINTNTSFAQEKNHRIFFDGDPVTRPEIYKWLNETKFTTGFMLPFRTKNESLNELHKSGYEVVLFLWANPDTRSRQFKAWNLTDEKISVHDLVDKHTAAAGGKQDKVIWELFVEDESAGVGFPSELLLKKPKTHADAYQLFNEYLNKSLEVAEPYVNVQKWATYGFGGSAHQFAKFKNIDMINVERANDDVDDIQTGIAFARGAARQYSKPWGMDFSLWWGPVYSGAERIPVSYHKRHYFISYFAGSHQSRMEGIDGYLRNGKLTNIGKCVDEFGKFIIQNKPGKPITTVAVVLPKDHGWNTPPYWKTTNTAWNYAKIPYRQGQKAIDAFFTMAFPGSNFAMEPFPFGKYKINEPPASPFALSCVTPEFAPSASDIYYAEPPVSFGKYETRDKAREDFYGNNLNPAEARPMGDSRWGDIIDVFTDDVYSDVLKEYKVIILLDQIELSDDLRNRLINAMNNGSTVFCPAGIAKPEHSEFTGTVMNPIIGVGRSWNLKDKDWVNEPFRYIPSQVKDASVIATTGDGSPLLISKTYGKGKLITSLVPWFEGMFNSLHGAVSIVLDEEIKKVQPVTVVGSPIEFLSAKEDGIYNVLLSNNSNTTWKGKVKTKNLTREYIKCSELLTGEKLKTNFSKDKETSVEVEVPPFDVRVISWSDR